MPTDFNVPGRTDPDPPVPPETPPPMAAWPETDWEAVRRLHQEGAEREEGLRDFCGRYAGVIRQEIEFQARKLGCPGEAEDLSQEFLLDLLGAERNLLAGVDQAKGRLRCYVGAMLRNFVLNHLRQGQALKRGGGMQRVEWEEDLGASAEPEISGWDQRLAREIFDAVTGALEADWMKRGKADRLWTLLKEMLSLDKPTASVELGVETGLGANHVRSEKHLLQKQFQELLRREVAQTLLCRPEDLAEEMRYIAKAWSAAEQSGD